MVLRETLELLVPMKMEVNNVADCRRIGRGNKSVLYQFCVALAVLA